jgi:hypothetical protein
MPNCKIILLLYVYWIFRLKQLSKTLILD